MIQEILGTELEKQGFTYMPNSSWSYDYVKDQVSNRHIINMSERLFK